MTAAGPLARKFKAILLKKFIFDLSLNTPADMTLLRSVELKSYRISPQVRG
ncbi:hypothetical protein ACVINX_007765 [Bradyrhizobium diazoefficiens]